MENICEKLSEGKTYTEIECELLQETKRCAKELMCVYVSQIDEEISRDKKGRKEAGYQVERRNDEKRIETQLGEIVYLRTYYKKAAGGYEYLADRFFGLNGRERVSKGLSLCLANAARDMSYEKCSQYLTAGHISRQTVMSRVRQSSAKIPKLDTRLRCVSELHIDADEAHITLCGGKKSEVPLISIYEGIEKQCKRHICKNIFHISEYGKTPDELWEQVLSEIELRYDISNTKIYVHGDGGNWIQTGLEWIPGAIFVLDKYHKNKAIKTMTAGLLDIDRKLFDREIRWALNHEDLEYMDEITENLCVQLPERVDKILWNARYLKRFVGGISICLKDNGANNGGCTEPHVSHILASRLSSRPMAWSIQTLKKFAPVLASGSAILCHSQQPTHLFNISKISVCNRFKKYAFGFPFPDSIPTLPITGKVTPTQKLLKLFL